MVRPLGGGGRGEGVQGPRVPGLLWVLSKAVHRGTPGSGLQVQRVECGNPVVVAILRPRVSGGAGLSGT